MKKKHEFRLRLIDWGLWREIRMAAASKGVTINQLILTAIKAYLELIK